MKVQVTQKDIDTGTTYDGSSCPVARAIKRVLPPAFTVHVRCTEFTILATDGGAREIYRGELPPAARVFISDFDRLRDVKQLEFHIDIPDDFLA